MHSTNGGIRSGRTLLPKPSAQHTPNLTLADYSPTPANHWQTLFTTVQVDHSLTPKFDKKQLHDTFHGQPASTIPGRARTYFLPSRRHQKLRPAKSTGRLLLGNPSTISLYDSRHHPPSKYTSLTPPPKLRAPATGRCVRIDQIKSPLRFTTARIGHVEPTPQAASSLTHQSL